MEINYFHLFRKYRKIFVLFTATAAIVSLVFVYRQSPVYEAGMEIYVSEAGNLQIVYAAIKSNRVFDGVINRLGLIKVFGVDNIDQARKILSNNLQAVLDLRLNTVDIKIRWQNALLASEIANVFTEELQKIYPEIRLPETVHDLVDFRVIDKAIPPIKPINQNKTGIVLLSTFLSAIAAIFVSLLVDFFSRGPKRGQ